MTDELKKRMARLRQIAPRLNKATDQVSKLASMVEKFLVDELHIGVAAETSAFSLWDDGQDDHGSTRRVVQTLAFGRIGGVYRIHVVNQTGILDENGVWNETDERVETPWPSCSRETKLKAFEKLTELLETLTANAEELVRTADETAAKVADVIGESEDSVDAPKLAPQFLACPSCGERGKVLNVASEHWGACSDCEYKWRIGTNLLPSWRDESPEEWKRNHDLLAGYTEDEV
jgi:hypothetical protein